MEGNDLYNKEDLLKFKEGVLKSFEKSHDLFERQLSFISAGGLGLTFILVEKVFKEPINTVYKRFLITSWVFFGATLLINLLSHSFASKQHSTAANFSKNLKPE